MSNTAKKFWDKKYKVREMVSPLDFTIKAYNFLKDKPQSTILDIGCGDGRDSLFFAEKNLAVTAIDFSKEAIKKLSSKNTSIDAHVMNILDMNFQYESFDAIYAHLSLHYFDDQTTDSVFKEIYRILKLGGYFFVKCKSIHDSLYGKGEKVGEDMYLLSHQIHFFSKEYMKNKLQDFVIVELKEISSTYDKKESCFIEAVARKN